MYNKILKSVEIYYTDETKTNIEYYKIGLINLFSNSLTGKQGQINYLETLDMVVVNNEIGPLNLSSFLKEMDQRKIRNIDLTFSDGHVARYYFKKNEKYNFSVIPNEFEDFEIIISTKDIEPIIYCDTFDRDFLINETIEQFLVDNILKEEY